MKKSITIAVCIAMALSLSSCSKGPADALAGMKRCQEQSDREGAKKFYTNGTVAAMEEMEKLAPDSEKESKSANNIAKDAEWEIVSEEISGDTAKVKVRFSEHPVEKMKGMEYTFKLKNEDGAWKIDMEKEMRQALELLKISEKMGKGGTMDFMNKMKELMK